jgi:hypothetical protein
MFRVIDDVQRVAGSLKLVIAVVADDGLSEVPIGILKLNGIGRPPVRVAAVRVICRFQDFSHRRDATLVQDTCVVSSCRLVHGANDRQDAEDRDNGCGNEQSTSCAPAGPTGRRWRPTGIRGPARGRAEAVRRSRPSRRGAPYPAQGQAWKVGHLRSSTYHAKSVWMQPCLREIPGR